MKDIIMRKVLLFPTLCLGVGVGHGYKTLEVVVELRKNEFTDWETMQEVAGYELSICGTGMGYGGQCLDTFKNKAEQYMIDELRRELFNRVFAIWDEYHLNTLNAGTKKQFECLEQCDALTLDYEGRCNVLKEQGLYDDNGYLYGHGWLGKQIPTEVLDEILSWEDIEIFTKEELSTIRRRLIRQYRKSLKEAA